MEGENSGFGTPREKWSSAESHFVFCCLVRPGASAGKYADGSFAVIRTNEVHALSA